MFSVSVSTVERSPSYIHRMVKSLCRNAAYKHVLDMYVGNRNISYLQDIARDYSVSIHVMDENIPSSNKIISSNMNMANCLDKTTDLILYVEDDIVFAKNWDQEVIDIVSSINVKDFVLSLYNVSSDERKYYEDPANYHSSQALLFTKGAAKLVRESIRRHYTEGVSRTYTRILVDQLKRSGLPFYFVGKSLVQHIGDISVLESGRHHISTSFKAS